MAIAVRYDCRTNGRTEIGQIMQGNLRSINLQHSFEVETLDREKLAVGECILDHRGIWTRNTGPWFC